MSRKSGKVPRDNELTIWEERALAEISPEVAASVERLSRQFKEAYEKRLKEARDKSNLIAPMNDSF